MVKSLMIGQSSKRGETPPRHAKSAVTHGMIAQGDGIPHPAKLRFPQTLTSILAGKGAAPPRLLYSCASHSGGAPTHQTLQHDFESQDPRRPWSNLSLLVVVAMGVDLDIEAQRATTEDSKALGCAATCTLEGVFF